MGAMTTTKTESVRGLDDAALVAETLEGNWDAYRQIVARYQSLICAVAYSGTGSVARSEDIAQETFVTAWKNLRTLREPEQLRSWLCGIARNLVSNLRRRARREPAEVGEPYDAAHELASSGSSPPEEAIRKEEEAILWRSLGNIPETYREPLVLYYREHRSIEHVAFQLGLTEDATRQRLARGRALLQEQVLAFIEGTLDRSKPGAAFTANVMSVLPVWAALGGATVSAGQGSTTAKAGTAMSGAGFTAVIMGLVGALGGFVGWQMSAADAQSELERIWVERFWRWLVIGVAVFVVPAVAIVMLWGGSLPWLPGVLCYYVAGVYVLIGVPFAIWAWQNHRRIYGKRTGTSSWRTVVKLFVGATLLAGLGAAGTVAFGFPSDTWTDLWLLLVFGLGAMSAAVAIWEWRQSRRRPSDAMATFVPRPKHAPALIWVAGATVAMAALLTVSLASSERASRVTASAARELIAAHPEAKIQIHERRHGSKTLNVVIENGGGVARYFAPADTATVAALERQGVSYRTLREGRDFELLGWPGRMLFVLSIFTVAAGSVILVRGWRNRRSYGQAPAPRG